MLEYLRKGGKGLNAGGCVTGVQIYADIVTTHGIPNAKLREGDIITNGMMNFFYKHLFIEILFKIF